ncbi:MAG: hypothetical protein IT432_10020 [Phycisphaerales bacterium]|nr:hypothetical protein [Phycisphaerales bacterium]
MHHASHRLGLGPLLLAMLLLPGCVFWDIRDGVRDANSRLDTVDASLKQTNSELKSVQSALTRLDTTNAELVKVQDELGQLDATNASLTNVQDRLQTLRAINDSLAKMDVHLSSLRKTIGRIDGMIPFLDLGSEESVAEASAPNPAPAEPANDTSATAAQPGDATQSPTDAAAPAPKDALIGAWIRQYPDRTVALVFVDATRYLMQRTSATGARTQETGTWKREGKVITLTGNPEPIKLADGSPGTRQSVERLEIVSQTTRSFSVTSNEGGLQIFAKP